MDFLKGTYGFDLLSIVLILLSFILNVFDITRILGLLILIYAIYRAFSKKIYKRKEEYNVFYTYTNKLLNKFGKSIPYNLQNYDLNNFVILFNNIKLIILLLFSYYLLNIQLYNLYWILNYTNYSTFSIH